MLNFRICLTAWIICSGVISFSSRSSILCDPDSAPTASLFNPALVARERAETQNDELLAHKLANADPFQLFVASLAALDVRAKKLAASAKTQQYRQLASQVSKAIQAVKEAGEWPDPVPNLEELLG